MVFSDRTDEEESDKAVALVRELDHFTGSGCPRCRETLCGHEVLFSVLLGAKDAPRCLRCLCRELDRPHVELRDQLAEFVQHRECYRHAWNVASSREGQAGVTHPKCLWPDARTADHRPVVGRRPQQDAERPRGVPATDCWDAGDMACGDLVLALRGRLNALAGGTVLKVTARDPAAPLDLPAWCRLTGHRLLAAEHPDYFIQRKET